MSLIDEESKFPKATDMTLLDKLHTQHGKHVYYEKPKLSKSTFIIKHYAGDVSYEVGGFLDKNRDSLQPELIEILQDSTNEFIRDLFPEPKEDPKATRKAKPSMGAQFKSQLSLLMDTLNTTQPYFVRCLKPNSVKKSGIFDHELVTAQLRYSGMMETIRIRKLGYPIRYTFSEFIDRYKVIVGKVSNDINALVQQITTKVGISADYWQMGVSKVFFKESVIAKLETARGVGLLAYVIRIQKTWRMYWIKKYYKQFKTASLSLQSAIRAKVAKLKYRKLYKAVVTVQSCKLIFLLLLR